MNIYMQPTCLDWVGTNYVITSDTDVVPSCSGPLQYSPWTSTFSISDTRSSIYVSCYITKGHLLIVIWLIVDSKDAYKQSLDSDKRCC